MDTASLQPATAHSLQFNHSEHPVYQHDPPKSRDEEKAFGMPSSKFGLEYTGNYHVPPRGPSSSEFGVVNVNDVEPGVGLGVTVTCAGKPQPVDSTSPHGVHPPFGLPAELPMTSLVLGWEGLEEATTLRTCHHCHIPARQSLEPPSKPQLNSSSRSLPIRHSIDYRAAHIPPASKHRWM